MQWRKKGVRTIFGDSNCTVKLEDREIRKEVDIMIVY